MSFRMNIPQTYSFTNNTPDFNLPDDLNEKNSLMINNIEKFSKENKYECDNSVSFINSKRDPVEPTEQEPAEQEPSRTRTYQNKNLPNKNQ